MTGQTAGLEMFSVCTAEEIPQITASSNAIMPMENITVH